ncbi:TPA: hypothetical protein ACU207_002302 [Mannheimia haemolytica]|uniref:hypothetical protein n=1 Tax=Mannheimia haemolytica TaxID=75985 RepID=UPI001ADB7254|nr:hypothetical protein [Mannheimia haemolytica]MCB4228091.1 hypothetical protein [Mannheimia haemolytica]MEE3732236.1 hypothetical protein [Mannheimia haemolytica]
MGERTMSLLKKAQTFISIFNDVRTKNEAQRQSSNNLNVALKNAAEMRAGMNGFSLKPQKSSAQRYENGYTTGYAGTGYYSNGVRIDDDI